MLSCMICVSLSLICIHYHQKLDLKNLPQLMGHPVSSDSLYYRRHFSIKFAKNSFHILKTGKSPS